MEDVQNMVERQTFSKFSAEGLLILFKRQTVCKFSADGLLISFKMRKTMSKGNCVPSFLTHIFNNVTA